MKKLLIILLFPLFCQGQDYKDFKKEFINMQLVNSNRIQSSQQQSKKNLLIIGVVTATGIGSYILNATNTTNRNQTALFFASGMFTAALINIKF